MTFDWFLAVTTFAVVACFTPGPNNAFLLSSGLTHGFARTLPPVVGVAIGFTIMVLAVAFGIAQLFQAFPVIYSVLKVGSVLYLLWLAWRIATADPKLTMDNGGRPLTFLEAAGFQWINPKACSVALAASAAYVVPDLPTLSVVAIAVVFLVAALGSCSTWAAGGTALRRLVHNPIAVRAINITLALLLVASLWPIAGDWVPR